MNVINVTSDALQQQTIMLPNGLTMLLTLYYRPIQQGWFINSLAYSTFEMNTMRITNQVNMLRQWKNILPFGIGCFSANNREPSLVQDFSSGQSQLVLLSEAEVLYYESLLTAGS